MKKIRSSSPYFSVHKISLLKWQQITYSIYTQQRADLRQWPAQAVLRTDVAYSIFTGRKKKKKKK